MTLQELALKVELTVTELKTMLIDKVNLLEELGLERKEAEEIVKDTLLYTIREMK